VKTFWLLPIAKIFQETNAFGIILFAEQRNALILLLLLLALLLTGATGKVMKHFLLN